MSEAASDFYQRIINYCAQYPRAVHWNYTAEIMVDNNTKIIPVRKVIERMVEQDFEKNYTDSQIISVYMDMTVYTHEFFPKREDFKVRIIREERHENPKLDLVKPRKQEKIYRGVLLDSQDKNLGKTEETSPLNNQIQDKDKRVKQVTIQLIELSVEKLRQVEIGGIFSDATPHDVMKALLTTVANDTDIPLGNKLTGCETIPPDMQDKVQQILIPHATNCLLLPEVIQKTQGGIYNHGIGLYIFKNAFYVYPMHNLRRFEKEKYKCTIVVIPKGEVGETKRTYVVNNGEIILFTHSEVQHVDVSNQKQIQEGTGRVVVDMNKMISDSAQVKDNKLTMDPSKATSAYVQNERKDGMNYVPTQVADATTTMANNLSQTSETQGRTMMLQWDYSCENLITPNMPCRVIYFKDNRKYQMDGIIMALRFKSVMQGDDMSSRDYFPTTTLGLVIQRLPEVAK